MTIKNAQAARRIENSLGSKMALPKLSKTSLAVAFGLSFLGAASVAHALNAGSNVDSAVGGDGGPVEASSWAAADSGGAKAFSQSGVDSSITGGATSAVWSTSLLGGNQLTSSQGTAYAGTTSLLTSGQETTSQFVLGTASNAASGFSYSSIANSPAFTGTSLLTGPSAARSLAIESRSLLEELGVTHSVTSATGGISLSSDANALTITTVGTTSSNTVYGFIVNADDDRDNVATAAGAAAAVATFSSATNRNSTVVNTGLIGTVTQPTIGIDILTTSESTAGAAATASADSRDGVSSGDVDYAYGAASASSAAYAESLTSGNTVTNSGQITAGSGAGIRLLSDADAIARAFVSLSLFSDEPATTFGDAQSEPRAQSLATVTSNTVLNSSGASIIATGLGIMLEADALADDASNASGSESAIALVNSNVVTNAGTIAAGSDGIRLRAAANGLTDSATVSGNTVTNTGIIYSMDDGIQLEAESTRNDLFETISENTIVNSYPGRIVSDSNSIELDSDNTLKNVVTNSGLLVSDTNMSLAGDVLTKGARSAFASGVAVASGVGVAVKFDSDGVDQTGTAANWNTLNLNAPSYIGGVFELQRYAAVQVNLTSGVSHSVRWVFDDAADVLDAQNNNALISRAEGARKFVLAGPVPWFTSLASLDHTGTGTRAQDGVDDVFATIDPSAFAAAPNQLTDLTGMVSSMAAEGMNRSGVTRNGFWMTVRGSRMDYKGDNRATMDQDTRLQGGAFGFNRDFGDLRVGVMAGYADSELEVGSFYSDLYRYSHENKADGGFAGVHVQGNLGAVKVGLGIMAGAMDHEDRRFVNDNLQWWGESYARATYDSRWYAPELSLSVPVAITETITLTPSLHGRYSVQKFDRYTETGSNSNATVHDHTIKMGEVRAGLDLTKKYAGGSTAGVQLGYIQRDLAGSDTVRVTMIGDTKNVPMFTRELGAGYASVKLNLAVTKAVSFQLDGTYVSGSEGKGGNVGAKLNVEF